MFRGFPHQSLLWKSPGGLLVATLPLLSTSTTWTSSLPAASTSPVRGLTGSGFLLLFSRSCCSLISLPFPTDWLAGLPTITGGRTAW